MKESQEKSGSKKKVSARWEAGKKKNTDMSNCWHLWATEEEKKVQTVKSVCFTYAITIHGEKPRMKYHKPARGIDQCPKKLQLQMFNQIYKMKPKWLISNLSIRFH